MTDRIHSLTVVLEHNIRDDDIELLIKAIKMIRWVNEVVPIVADSAAYMAESRAHTEWSSMLHNFSAVCGDSKTKKKTMDFLQAMYDERFNR